MSIVRTNYHASGAGDEQATAGGGCEYYHVAGNCRHAASRVSHPSSITMTLGNVSEVRFVSCLLHTFIQPKHDSFCCSSEYELKRQRLIEENKKLLEELGLAGDNERIAPISGHKVKRTTHDIGLLQCIDHGL